MFGFILDELFLVRAFATCVTSILNARPSFSATISLDAATKAVANWFASWTPSSYVRSLREHARSLPRRAFLCPKQSRRQHIVTRVHGLHHGRTRARHGDCGRHGIRDFVRAKQ